ncbi:MAG: hypothetical protein AAB657_00010 [Patescibacteria group bacterium]
MKKILFYHLPTDLTVLVIFSILSTAVFAPIFAWAAVVVDLGMVPVWSITPKQQVKSAVSKKTTSFVKVQHTPNAIKEKTGQSITITAESYQTSGVRSISLYIKDKLVKTCTPPNDSLNGSCIFTGTNYLAGNYNYKAKVITSRDEVWSRVQNFVVQEVMPPVIITDNLPNSSDLFFPGDTTNWDICGTDSSGIKEIKMYANDNLFRTYKNISSGECQSYNYNINTVGLVRAYVVVIDKFDNIARWPETDYFEFNVSSSGYSLERSWQVSANSRLAVDTQGNIYVANNNIKKYDSVGNLISTIAENGSHYVIAVDGNGYIYSAKGVWGDRNHRVEKIDQQGNLVLSWGTLGSGNGQFRFPSGVVVDSANNVYVIEEEGSRVQKFTNQGNFIRSFSLGSANRYLVDIWVSSGGYIYVVGDAGCAFVVLNPSGVLVKRGDLDCDQPFGAITADTQNNFYVNKNSTRIYKYNLQGNNISRFGSLGSGDGQFTKIFDMVMDSQNKLYVVDQVTGKISKFIPN